MATFVIEPHFRLQEWVAEEKGYFRAEGLDYVFRELVQSYEQEHDIPAADIAAAIAVLAQDGEPLFLEEMPEPRTTERRERREPAGGLVRWRIAVGKRHRVEPRQIVGALASRWTSRRPSADSRSCETMRPPPSASMRGAPPCSGHAITSPSEPPVIASSPSGDSTSVSGGDGARPSSVSPPSRRS